MMVNLEVHRSLGCRFFVCRSSCVHDIKKSRCSSQNTVWLDGGGSTRRRNEIGDIATGTGPGRLFHRRRMSRDYLVNGRWTHFPRNCWDEDEKNEAELFWTEPQLSDYFCKFRSKWRCLRIYHVLPDIIVFLPCSRSFSWARMFRRRPNEHEWCADNFFALKITNLHTTQGEHKNGFAPAPHVFLGSRVGRVELINLCFLGEEQLAELAIQ